MSPFFLARCFFSSALLLSQSVFANVLIYDLDFRTTGPAVNFITFRDGYIVVDVAGETFDSVIILENPDTGKPYYISSLIKGSYFELQNESGGAAYTILEGASNSTNTVESIALQILGKSSGNVKIGSGISQRVARRLRGMLFANSNEVVTTDENLKIKTEYGFAGFNQVTARFDSTSTRDANNARLSPATTLSAIQKTLERRGIPPEPAASPTPPPSPTPTPTPTPTP